MKKVLTAAALALAAAVTSVAFASPAAATTQACVTSSLTTGPYEGVGTIRNKSATSSCSDLNLTYSNDTTADNYDYYAGRLRRSNGTWFTCSRGYVYATDGYHSVNDPYYWLCTDVSDNTPFTVASSLDSGDSVQITH